MRPGYNERVPPDKQCPVCLTPLSSHACLGHLDSGGNNSEGRTLLMDGRHALGLRQLGRGWESLMPEQKWEWNWFLRIPIFKASLTRRVLVGSITNACSWGRTCTTPASGGTGCAPGQSGASTASAKFDPMSQFIHSPTDKWFHSSILMVAEWFVTDVSIPTIDTKQQNELIHNMSLIFFRGNIYTSDTVCPCVVSLMTLWQCGSRYKYVSYRRIKVCH